MSAISPDKLGFSGAFKGDLSDLWNLRLDPTGQGSYASIQEDRDAYQARLRKRMEATGEIGGNPDFDPAQTEERNKKIRESMRGQQGYASNILSMGSGPNTDYGMKNLSGLTEIAPQTLAQATSESASTGNLRSKNRGHGQGWFDRNASFGKGRASDILGPPLRRGGPVRPRI